MAYHFVQLTLSSGKPVYINGDQVAAVYQPNNQDTLVQLAGDDDNYLHVKESVEKVTDILFEMMND